MALLGFVALSAAGCAGVAPASRKVAEFPNAAVCHKVTTNKRTAVYCGSAYQWVELNRRVAWINAGVTCRWARSSRETCLSAEQWRRLGASQAGSATVFGFGEFNPPPSSHSTPSNNGPLPRGSHSSDAGESLSQAPADGQRFPHCVVAASAAASTFACPAT